MSQRITIVTGRNLRGVARQIVEHPIDPTWYYSVLRSREAVRDCRGGWRDRTECEQDAADHWPVDPAARTLGRKGGAVGSEAQKAAARANGKKGGRPKKA